MKHYLPLSELCVINMGQSPDSTSYNTEKRGLPFFQGNADFGKISPHVRIWCDAPTKIAHAGDLLLSVRAPIGALNIADSDCCIGRGLAAMTCIDKKCDQRWLFFALQSKVAELQSKGTGSTFKAISKKTLFDTLLPDYPIAEQREIARNLDCLTRMIFIREKQMEKIIQLASSRFIEMFGDPDSNEKHWAVCSVKDCVKSIQNGKSPICENYPRIGNSPGVLKLSSISSGNFRPSENKAMRAEIPFSQEYEVCSGDLLLSRKNTYELVGMACYVFQTPSMLQLPDLIFRLQVQKKVHGIYLWQLLNYPTFRSRIQSLAGGSAGSMPNISKQRLEKLMIPLPPLSLQNEFAAFIEQLDKSKVVAEKEQKALAFLRLSAYIRLKHGGENANIESATSTSRRFFETENAC